MLKVGMIGLGHWGPNLFRNFYEHPDVSLEIICDKSPDKQRKLNRYKVPFTTDYTEVVAPGNGLDAVIVATPLGSHYEIALAALKAGKHLFIEKPIAPSAQQVRELMTIADQKGLCFIVGHVFLYNSGICRAKSDTKKTETNRTRRFLSCKMDNASGF